MSHDVQQRTEPLDPYEACAQACERKAAYWERCLARHRRLVDKGEVRPQDAAVGERLYAARVTTCRDLADACRYQGAVARGEAQDQRMEVADAPPDAVAEVSADALNNYVAGVREGIRITRQAMVDCLKNIPEPEVVGG